MKLINFALVIFLVANLSIATTLGLSTWNINDIKHFLKDRKVNYDPSLSDDELTRLAESEFEKVKQYDKVTVNVNDRDQQYILELATDPNSDLNDVLPYHNWDYLFRKDDEDSNQIKGWIFEAWSVDNLKKFLKGNKVKFNKHSSKKELIDLSKSKYEEIAELNDVSGNYPGDWLYKEWKTDDMKKWLSNFDIPYEDNENRDSLLNKVKENNYLASISIKDSKKSLLDSLHLFEKSIFGKYGKVKDEFYDTWSYPQLKEWLYYHGLIDLKQDLYNEELDFDKLKALAKANELLLIDDIKSWSEKLEESSSPYISKGPTQGKKDYLDSLINDTFLLGIEKWSKDRLRDFLRARGINASYFLPKYKLVEMVKKNKDVPVKDTESNSINWILDTMSNEAIRNWLHDQGEAIEGSRKELMERVSNYLSSNPSKSIKSYIKIYKPDLDDYRKYLIATYKQDKDKVNSLSDQVILSTYAIAVEYYNQASKSIGVNDAKFSADDALNDVQRASYEYASGMIQNYDDKKSKLNDHMASAKIAANEYAKTLSSKFVEDYEVSRHKVRGFFHCIHQWLMDMFRKIKNLVFWHKSKVEQTVNEAYEGGQDYASLASGSAKSAYGEYKSYVGQRAQEYAEAVNENYQEYKPKAESAYSQAAESAQSAYKEYKPAVEKSAKKAYETAKKYTGAANEKMQHDYKAAKPKVEQMAINSWEYLINTYSNADLRAYLMSFGYDYRVLGKLNRHQLMNLAKEQTRYFFGLSKSKWDKSIVDVLKDTSESFRASIGLKKEEQSFWSKLKSILI